MFNEVELWQADKDNPLFKFVGWSLGPNLTEVRITLKRSRDKIKQVIDAESSISWNRTPPKSWGSFFNKTL